MKELDDICARLDDANHPAAVVLASVPDEIRSYGHVKEKSLAEARILREQRRLAFCQPQSARPPASLVAA